MAKEQYLDLAGLTTYDEEIKSHIETVADEKADIQHNHTVSEITDLLDLTEEEIAELCEFDGNPDNIIPVASKASMGCVVAGDGLDIDDNGVLSVQSLTDEEIESICEFDEGMTEDNVIPKATRTALGCVKVGDGLAIDSAGRLSATGGGSGVATAGIGSAGMKLLWENENPTASFEPQTIELDLSEYDEIAIDFIYSGTYSNGISRTVFQKNEQKAACMGFIGNVLRLATCTDTGVQFGYGEYYTTYNSVSSITQENLVMIPQRIYGVDVAPPNVDYTLTEEKDVKELLWTNPDSTADFAAQTINLDLSDYDCVDIVFKNQNNGDLTACYKIRIGEKHNAIYYANIGANAAALLQVRATTVSSTGITFGEGKQKSTNVTTAATTNNAYIIPIAIYGIKNKINVTTAVVTDKGQHTDLLWENASPNNSFAAQTIELDLNGYNEVEIVYKVDNGTTAEQQSMTAVVGRTCRLDAIGQSSGKPHVSKRNATINETSIVFEGSSYVTTSTSDWVSSTVHVIPVEIYGIKHNAATTSTIMGDYVVEEGTIVTDNDTTWEYVKRASGFMELKGYRDATIISSEFKAWGSGGIYHAEINGRNFPFTFKELWDCNCHVYSSTGSATLWTNTLYNVGAQATTEQTGDYSAARVGTVSSNVAIRVFYEAFGKWK